MALLREFSKILGTDRQTDTHTHTGPITLPLRKRGVTTVTLAAHARRGLIKLCACAVRSLRICIALIRGCEEMATLEVSPGRRAIDTLSSVGCATMRGTQESRYVRNCTYKVGSWSAPESAAAFVIVVAT